MNVDCVTGKFARIFASLVMLLPCIIPVYGDNSVSRSLSDSVVPKGRIMLIGKGLSNSADDKTDIWFDLISSEPFIIYKVEWINVDSVRETLQPFYLEANNTDGKATAWHINLEFPFTSSFGQYDQLKIHTDKGIIRQFTSSEGQYEHEIRNLKKNHDEYVAESKRSVHNIRIVAAILLAFIIVGGGFVFIMLRRRLAKRRMEIEELSLMIEERSETNLALRRKVNELYKSRLDTLNMLCNGYFDNNESEKMKEVFYKDVEKQILALRDNKSVEALEDIVNEYLDNTMLRIREQIPELTLNDLKFLTYIYAGFSPRAVCIFMNIKIKTFYNRRNMLKERILESDAPDREILVSKMFR